MQSTYEREMKQNPSSSSRIPDSQHLEVMGCNRCVTRAKDLALGQRWDDGLLFVIEVDGGQRHPASVHAQQRPNYCN